MHQTREAMSDNQKRTIENKKKTVRNIIVIIVLLTILLFMAVNNGIKREKNIKSTDYQFVNTVKTAEYNNTNQNNTITAESNMTNSLDNLVNTILPSLVAIIVLNIIVQALSRKRRR
jgi:ABC-type transport system involved in multi-copper enzyme maturation permease subunit